MSEIMRSKNASAHLNKETCKTWDIPDFEALLFHEKKSRYCICIFVLNEMGRLHTQLEQMRSIIESGWDVILADGGSTDGSNDPASLERLGIRGILIKKNPGKLGAQMRMAFAFALEQGYEGVITVDGNNKDNVTAGFLYFVEKLDAGYDHIQGSRFIQGGDHKNTPFARLLGVRLLHAPLIALASGFPYTDTTNGFRAYSKKFLLDPILDLFRQELAGYELHYFLAIEAGRNTHFRTIEVPVSRYYPQKGTVPTKITGILGNLQVLKVLFLAVSGAYRPHSSHNRFQKYLSRFK